MHAVILYSSVASEVTAGLLKLDESQADMSHDIHSEYTEGMLIALADRGPRVCSAEVYMAGYMMH